MKRIRVGNACAKCRELKAKCDGRQPVCSRCEGYGFQCSWARKDCRRTRSGVNAAGNISTESRRSQPDFAQAMDSYETLVESLKGHLDTAQQEVVNLKLSNIRRLVSQDGHWEGNSEAPSLNQVAGRNPHNGLATIPSRTYVGKASEINFIRRVRQYVGEEQAVEEAPVQDYSQDHGSATFTALRLPILLPSREEADRFVSVYLSTIHIAYPFLSRSTVVQALEKFHAQDTYQAEFRPWLAILNFIFAIGSYYTSFSSGKNPEDGSHFKYYQQGVFYSKELDADCELVSLHVLLVQCFFLLAVSLTERSWITLGFAIRMAQSIGLHIESPATSSPNMPEARDLSIRRRTWYSMYVLDRLLSVQLGRPVAIHDADFRVELPSKGDTSPFLSPGDIQEPLTHTDEVQTMDYFLEVIQFSYILGSVIRSLYQPSQIDSPPDQMLLSALILDDRLIEWRRGLPRHLRFDLGHPLERSITFKRQRNMLAVKYHHLRALIHRPFLCLPVLQGKDSSFADILQGNRERISEAERICITEAKQTAQLLHNVTDEQSLVHDFPWWQMISCLICASSILFVAATFHSSEIPANSESSKESLREDAETCLKVFQALGNNSPAAQKAANMLEQLFGTRPVPDTNTRRMASSSYQPLSGFSAGASTDTSSYNPFDPNHHLPSPEFSEDVSSIWEWPGDMSNSMEWSLRFLDFAPADKEFSEFR